MKTQQIDSKGKGPVGEARLNSWFHENGINYLSVNQQPDTFAHNFYDYVKRPDFLVLHESLGMIAVDAKNCTQSNGFFTLTQDEVKRALAFEMLARLPFWFLFLHESEGVTTWFWISSLRALESGLVRTNQKTKAKFLAISMSEFVRVQTYEDIGKLHNYRLRCLGRIFDKL